MCGSVRGGGGVRVGVIKKFLWKLKKKFLGGGRGGGVGLGGQAGCKRRIEGFVKIQKKKFFFLGGGGWGGWAIQGGCERRIEVFVKIQKKIWGGGGSGWM